MSLRVGDVQVVSAQLPAATVDVARSGTLGREGWSWFLSFFVLGEFAGYVACFKCVFRVPVQLRRTSGNGFLQLVATSEDRFLSACSLQ